jgi:heme exporter protein A
VIALRERGTSGTDDTVALELSGIAHRFAGRWVLRGCSLSLARGEALALLGGNGAGKTTLLRIIATLLRPTRGSARVLGLDLASDGGAVRERIGMMGFAPALYEDLSATENLLFTCRMRGVRPDAGRIARVLDEVGLAGHADTRVRGFSSGMRRRVAVARLLLHTPELLLLDEPYAALDDDGAGLVNDIIRQVIGRGGAVIAATHDLPRAAEVMDRVVRIEAGLLRELEPHASLGGAGAYAERWATASPVDAEWKG